MSLSLGEGPSGPRKMSEASLIAMLAATGTPANATDIQNFKIWSAINKTVRFPAPIAALPTTPTVRFIPHFSDTTVVSGRTTASKDMMGLADAAAISAVNGPEQVTDALGRRFWRFSGSEALEIADALAVTQRAGTLFVVGRHHINYNVQTVFSLGRNTGTPVNALAGMMRFDGTSSKAPTVAGYGQNSNAAANANRMIAGCQMQVIGVASRTTANGGIRFMHNGDFCDVAQATAAGTGTGAEIGRFAFTPGAANNWLRMDIYELVYYNGELTNAQAMAIQAALQAAWGIPNITGGMIFDGDSITAAAGISSAYNPAMLRCDPGTNWNPATRIVNMAVQGAIVGIAADAASVNSLFARLKAANGIYASNMLLGGERVYFQIGRNDVTSTNPTYYPSSSANTAQRGTDVYNAIVTYLNDADGHFAEGRSVVIANNIASTTAVMTSLTPLRAALSSSPGVINSQFLTDTNTGSGGTYDGKLSLVDLANITASGDSKFLTAADAADTLYYQGDLTHPTILGQQAIQTGGDNPAYGLVQAIAP